MCALSETWLCMFLVGAPKLCDIVCCLYSSQPSRSRKRYSNKNPGVEPANTYYRYCQTDTGCLGSYPYYNRSTSYEMSSQDKKLWWHNIERFVGTWTSMWVCAWLTLAHQGVFLVPESCSASSLLLTVCHFCLFFLWDLFTITNVLLLDELMSYSHVTQPENIYIQIVFRSYKY